ncbi:MAG: phosphatidylserine decarboxylase family protein, partial [Gemmatimonadales bacterium]
MIRTAPEGRPFIVGAWVIAAALVVTAARTGSVGWWVAAALWAPLAVWVVAFFRDPERLWTRGANLIVAPADGEVVGVVETDEPAFFCDRVVRVSIFMSVFDCHVNRYPADGMVTYRHYNPGRFGHAAVEKASLVNEQSTIGLATEHGKLLIRQIAGLIARRIITDHQVGTAVNQTERMGMIRFGSRVDLFMPLGTRVMVKPGDTTRVGVTV